MKEWQTVKLGDVILDIKDGGTPSRKHPEYFGGDIYWCIVKDIKPKIFDTKEKLTQSGLAHCSAKVWPIDSIIISLGATIGEVGITKVPIATKQGLSGIVINKKKVLLEYLVYVLKDKKEFINEIATGATIKEVRPKKLIEVLAFPLPPLSEQKLIVNILDSVSAAIDKAKAFIEMNLLNAKALFESILSRIFLEGINDKKWSLEKLEKYNKVVVGYVGPISKEYTIDPEGVLLLSTKNINYKGISLEKLTRINYEFHNKNKKSQLTPGDILVARHGNSGQAAVIPENIKEAHALNVIIIKRSQILSSEYICFLLNSGVLDKITSSKGGSVQEIINTSIIKDLIIPVPDLKTQIRIVKELSELSCETKKLEALYKQKLNDLEELKKSVLQKAFAGELIYSSEKVTA